jgi:hypothetical protein
MDLPARIELACSLLTVSRGQGEEMLVMIRPDDFRRIARCARLLGAALLSVFLVAGPVVAASTGPVEGGALPGPLPLFPPDNWWNLDISQAPVDPSSASFINFINNGGTRHLHPDFGGEASPGSAEIYGMPYAVVDGTQPPLLVGFVLYGDDSDGVGVPFYPIPAQAITQPHWVEGGDPGNVDDRSQDRHLLIVDRDHKYLYELYNVYYNSATGLWEAGSAAFWDMSTNNRRPESWTSADAAGLAILPGLVRYDEAYGPSVAAIQHAFRVTVRATSGHVYPASHSAGSTAGALPLGARLRLKSSKDLSTFTPEVRKIVQAMKTYGLIVADNGTDMYITGTFDTRWNNDILNPAFNALTASDFEVIQRGWNPNAGTVSLSSIAVNPAGLVGGQASTGVVTLNSPALGSVVVTLASANPGVASVPPSVTLSAGAISKSFSIATAAVDASTPVGITATGPGATRSATLTVTGSAPPPPPTLASLKLKPTAVAGGSASTGTVTLAAAAPAGGVVVTLASSDPTSASVPQRVTVTAGSSSASFTVTTMKVSATTSVVISASVGSVTKTATLSIRKRLR